MPDCRIRNDLFNNQEAFDLGRSKFVFMLWYLVKCVFFLSALPWPSRLKAVCLRCFGAKVGRNVYLKPRINIHIPWNLSIGDHTWIGEEVCIINFAPVTIGAHCCLSQRAFLCAANHDFTAENMRYRHAPILVQDGAWIGAQAFVGPGVTLGQECVLTAGSLVTHSTEPAMIYSGNPARAVKPRWVK